MRMITQYFEPDDGGADSGGTVYRLDTWMLGQLVPAK